VRVGAGKEAAMSSTVVTEESVRQPRLFAWLVESFWIADVMFIAMFGFFIALGAFNPLQTTGMAVGLGGLAAVYAVRVWLLHRRREELQRTPESRAARERRGF
jgi:uncharacterized membrane protein